jgi:hypothetical protein
MPLNPCLCTASAAPIVSTLEPAARPAAEDLGELLNLRAAMLVDLKDLQRQTSEQVLCEMAILASRRPGFDRADQLASYSVTVDLEMIGQNPATHAPNVP